MVVVDAAFQIISDGKDYELADYFSEGKGTKQRSTQILKVGRIEESDLGFKHDYEAGIAIIGVSSNYENAYGIGFVENEAQEIIPFLHIINASGQAVDARLHDGAVEYSIPWYGDDHATAEITKTLEELQNIKCTQTSADQASEVLEKYNQVMSIKWDSAKHPLVQGVQDMVRHGKDIIATVRNRLSTQQKNGAIPRSTQTSF